MTQPAGPDKRGGSVHGSNGGNSEPDRESRLAKLCMDSESEGTLEAS